MSIRIFIHGLESGNQGTKSIFFRAKYPDMIIPNFTGDLPKRMKKLKGVLAEKSDITLVGSSFGGLMAALFALENEPRVKKMVLLAPAINFTEFAGHTGEKISIPVWVYHGIEDQVIPLKEVKTVAEKKFQHLSFHAVEDDHFLHKTFKSIDWEKLLF